MDQVDFPVAVPFFDLLFPKDCRFDCVVKFEPNQMRNVMLTSETGNEMLFVLPRSSDEVVRHTDV